MTTPPPTRALQLAFAVHNAGIARAAREHDEHPIEFATDDLCETCQTKPRDGTNRKCAACRARKRRAA